MPDGLLERVGDAGGVHVELRVPVERDQVDRNGEVLAIEGGRDVVDVVDALVVLHDVAHVLVVLELAVEDERLRRDGDERVLVGDDEDRVVDVLRIEIDDYFYGLAVVPDVVGKVVGVRGRLDVRVLVVDEELEAVLDVERVEQVGLDENGMDLLLLDLALLHYQFDLLFVLLLRLEAEQHGFPDVDVLLRIVVYLQLKLAVFHAIDSDIVVGLLLQLIGGDCADVHSKYPAIVIFLILVARVHVNFTHVHRRRVDVIFSADDEYHKILFRNLLVDFYFEESGRLILKCATLILIDMKINVDQLIYIDFSWNCTNIG